MKIIHVALLFALGQPLPATARADDREDYPDTCSPPVQLKLDADWQADAIHFRESSLRILTRYLEGEEAARRQFKASLQLAQVTRASAFDVIELTKELVLRGFRGKWLESMRLAALDVQARWGGDLCGRFTRAMGMIQGKRALSEADLRDLEDVVPGDAVRDALGRRLGLRGADPAIREQVGARLRDESIDSPAGIAAVLDALTRQLREPQLGDAARGGLSACITSMSRNCPRREAEEHCKSTPREYLELMRKDL